MLRGGFLQEAQRTKGTRGLSSSFQLALQYWQSAGQAQNQHPAPETLSWGSGYRQVSRAQPGLLIPRHGSLSWESLAQLLEEH